MMNNSMQELLEAARAAQASAYARYSGYAVGAAVRTSEGKIVRGCNVENMSYGLSVCAERVAVFSAVCSGARGLEAIAIVGPGESPTLPCGACLQVLFEFGPDLLVLCSGAGGDVVTSRLSELLPHPFRL
jgi:cytidine deaminase